MPSPNLTTQELVVYCLAVGIAVILLVGISGGVFPVIDNGEPDSGGQLASENLPPHISIPENEYRAFYAGADEVIDEDEEDFDWDDIDTNISGDDEIRSIESILEDSQTDLGAGFTDIPHHISQSLVEIDGLTLGEYRESQVENIQFDTSYSYVYDPWEGETKTDGVIADAYVGILGTDNEVEPAFDTGTDRWIGEDGDMFTYLDYRYDEDVLPENDLQDPEVVDGGDRQIQDYYIYQVDNTDINRTAEVEYIHPDFGITSIETDTGGLRGGEALEYSIPGQAVTAGVTLHTSATVTAESTETYWQRERDRIDDSRNFTITGSSVEQTIAETEATAVIEDHPRGAGGTEVTVEANDTATANVEGETTVTFEETITELDGNREIDIEEDVTVPTSGNITGTISGNITGELDDEPPTTINGTISGEIEGEIDGETTEEIDYWYWDYWDSENEQDIRGWEAIDEEIIRTDEITVNDSQDMFASGTNEPPEVTQRAIEINEDRYHVIGSLDYPGHETGTNMSQETLTSQYLWSMMAFGETAFLENDWKMYSETRFETAEQHGDFGSQSAVYYNQLGVHLFSEQTGPLAVSGEESIGLPVELEGWRGDYVDIEHDELPENIFFDEGQPVMYTDFAIKNLPSPATELISIHGDVHEVDEDNIETIPYIEPDVTIDPLNETHYEINVTGKNDTPLDDRELGITGVEEEGVYTTDENGTVTVEAEGRSHINIEVEGDDFEDFLVEDPPEAFYGEIVAQQTLEGEGIFKYAYDAIQQAFLATPLILLYFLWKRFDLGR